MAGAVAVGLPALSRRAARRAAGGALLLLGLLPAQPGAQIAAPPGGVVEPGLGAGQRPSERALPQPGLEAPAAPAPLVLPPITPPPQEPPLSAGLSVYVRRYRITGNSVFDPAELAAVAAPYEAREVTEEDLEELRRALTLYYVDHGYINSGALIPDQAVSDGVVEIRIVEGGLGEIEVQGLGHLSPRYVSERLALGAGPPLNIERLQEQVQLLLQSPLIERINARLQPGARRGEARLVAQAQEARRYHVAALLDNGLSPAVGTVRSRLHGGVYDVTGLGDVLDGEVAFAAGATDLSLSYALPLNARDTSLTVFGERVESEVVEDPFSTLNIRSKSWSAGVRVSQPLLRTPGRQLSTALALERRHSRTFLLERGFPFSPGVSPDGDSDVTVVRWTGDWLSRSRAQVIAARSTLSIGVDAFGATVHAQGPDGRFVAWLGQLQWARRLGEGGSELHFRASVQLASAALLPLEKFSVGGARSVRGYRENQLVRDRGYTASLELRIPVLRDAGGRSTLRLAPFVDLGGAWNIDAPTPAPSRLASVGLGLRWDPQPRLHAELYWGHALDDAGNPRADPQDYGIHFLLRANLLD